jgi:hypothetical protein
MKIKVQRSSLKIALEEAKQFLHRVHTCDPDELDGVLHSASVEDLETLCKVLFCLANGLIPLQADLLTREKIAFFKRNFRNLTVSALADAPKRLVKLKRMRGEYKVLLHYIFSKDD